MRCNLHGAIIFNLALSLIKPTGTPALLMPACSPFIKGGGAGPALFHDPVSDGEFPGRIRVRKVPVEMVPTPDKILCINRYF